MLELIHIMCPKLSMHPAPGVHIFRAGCTIFKDVHPECAHFCSHLSLLHIRRVHGEVPGCTVSEGESLISDTADDKTHVMCLVRVGFGKLTIKSTVSDTHLEMG